MLKFNFQKQVRSIPMVIELSLHLKLEQCYICYMFIIQKVEIFLFAS